MWILVQGRFDTGFDLYGPFTDWTYAEEFSREATGPRAGGEYWFEQLKEPYPTIYVGLDPETVADVMAGHDGIGDLDHSRKTLRRAAEFIKQHREVIHQAMAEKGKELIKTLLETWEGPAPCV